MNRPDSPDRNRLLLAFSRTRFGDGSDMPPFVMLIPGTTANTEGTANNATMEALEVRDYTVLSLDRCIDVVFMAQKVIRTAPFLSDLFPRVPTPHRYSPFRSLTVLEARHS